MKNSFSIRGVTLLEIMLVLSIATTLLLAGFRNFQSYKFRQQVEAIQFQVGTLFGAASLYYRVNCRGTYTSSEGQQTSDTLGKLYPNTGIPTTARVLDINADLITPGFLLKPINPNVLISNYIVQFYPVTIDRRTYRALGYDPASKSYTLPIVDDNNSMSAATNTPKILFWQIQVAAKLADPTKADVLQKILGATCTTKDGSGGAVLTCDENGSASGSSSASTGSSNPYLLWVRLPSFAEPELVTPLWHSNQMRQQFNLQYTNDQMYELNNSQNISQPTQYYLCGG